MKKLVLNLGKALNKKEQKSIDGGSFIRTCTNFGGYCDINHICERNGAIGICVSIELE